MRGLPCFLLAAAAFASAPSLAQITARDDRGVELHWDSPPNRIISLLPSLTEAVCALGACQRLVGTDRFSNWPRSVESLPKLGGLDDAPIERIVALKPDLVLLSDSARVIDRLESLGIKVLVLASNDRADARRALFTLARVLGRPDAAVPVWNRIESETDAAAARVPPALRGQRVYFEIDATPYGAGTGSFIGETLMRLGLRDALPESLGPYPKLNPEYLVRLQPDIVMGSAAAVAEMGRRPGWSALRAVREARTCGFTTQRQDLLMRPGPRMGEAAAVIADCLAEIGARDAALAPVR